MKGIYTVLCNKDSPVSLKMTTLLNLIYSKEVTLIMKLVNNTKIRHILLPQ